VWREALVCSCEGVFGVGARGESPSGGRLLAAVRHSGGALRRLRTSPGASTGNFVCADMKAAGFVHAVVVAIVVAAAAADDSRIRVRSLGRDVAEPIKPKMD